MKAYRISIQDHDEGNCYVWASSLREVKKRARELLDELGREGDFVESIGDIERIDISPDWLHRNFNRDNG